MNPDCYVCKKEERGRYTQVGPQRVVVVVNRSVFVRRSDNFSPNLTIEFVRAWRKTSPRLLKKERRNLLLRKNAGKMRSIRCFFSPEYTFPACTGRPPLQNVDIFLQIVKPSCSCLRQESGYSENYLSPKHFRT